MKAQEIRALSDDQVRQKLLDLRKEQMGLRFRAATDEADKTHRFGEIKRDIARLKTVMNERVQQAEQGGN